VESFLVLNALGVECLEDFERLREDEGLAEMLGHDIPSSEAARKFLYQFHDETSSWRTGLSINECLRHGWHQGLSRGAR
jgi:hypothetical protein